MELMKAIAKRQSCRAYTGEQITESELQTILQAANAAPVAHSKYSNVKLTVIQNSNMLEKIDAVGAEVYKKPNMKIRFGAPTLILVSVKIISDRPEFLKNSGISEEEMNLGAYCDAACIMENMALAATDLGLGNVYLFGAALAIAKNPELCAELKIPAGYIPVSALPVGKAVKPLKERELTLSKIATEYIK